LTLKIFGAKNLLAVDSAGLLSSKKSSSDPFIKIQIPEFETYKMQLMGKTKVVEKCLDPTYDESFSFILRENMVSERANSFTYSQSSICWTFPSIQ